MDILPIFHIILLAVLLFLSACFSGSETAFFALKRTKIKQLQAQNDPKSKKITALLSNPRRLLVTILLGNELVNIASTAIATTIAIELFGKAGLALAILGMIVLLLLCGEVTPKTLAIYNPLKFARLIVRPLSLFYKLISPLRKFIQGFVDMLLRPFNIKHVEKPISEDEFKSLVDLSQDEGILERTELEMIENVFELTEITAAEVMISRKDMFCLPLDESLGSAMKKIKKNLYARIPIYQKSMDNIAGILYTKDLLIYQTKIMTNKSIKDIMHSPRFIPPSKKIGELLREFQSHKVHIAVVVNRQGKTMGLVYLHDVLEELFGEITDESQIKIRLIRQLNKNTYKISAMMHIDDFNQTLKVDLPVKDFETVGGFLRDLWGRMPKKGETIRFNKLEFTVTKAAPGHIAEVLVKTK